MGKGLAMSKNLASNIINLVLLLMGVGLFISAQGIETGAAMAQGGDFMPKLCSGIWMVLGILLFLFGLREKPAEGGGSQVSLKGFGVTLALLLLYVLLLKPVGFVITSIVYLFLQMCLFVPAEKKDEEKLYPVCRDLGDYAICGELAVCKCVRIDSAGGHLKVEEGLAWL